MTRRIPASSLAPAILALLALLAACDEPPPPPQPVETEPAEPEAPPEPEPEPFVEHALEEGQTLWDVARSYDVSVDAIMEFNELRPRDVRRLSKGRVLRIPGVEEAVEVSRAYQPTPVEELPELEDGAYHVLQPGETLWDLAHTYEKSIDELMARNELDDEAVRGLRPGRAVIIPGIEQDDVRQAEDAAESRGMRHRVRRGETIWDLARSFRVSVSALMAANRFSPQDAQALREGQQIWIPGGTWAHRDDSPRLTPRQRRAQARARRLGLGTRQVAQRLLHGHVEARWIRAAGGRRLPGTLRWPVTNGRFVRGYGSGEGSYHLAVDITGDIGWNVRAAAPGIVAYSGDEVPGYGHMVLVVHPGGWVTMYAHNSINFVVAGETVPRGAVLAELGSTGISRGPHVHFEFIHDGKNCDPATLFRPGVRHASRLARIPREVWRDPDEPPEGVRCARRRRHPRSRWVVNE
ncbi:MAG TPA: LysM peptidoglycan-binding domain-containing M23 family metallopeptidase [Polyangiaceae bacterium LLY-WYZ-15_(1-7)]|nr:LysM peptidoglycan-binding domain-containing M23 family metallopeptidase [Polyangiaceae bacterium LLY-WYZ-15_(1-7)]HJL01231.1 LysM peptidoglycan-binding domain-containing M23 family metallopeptidase [Polyangiaceae bacterium LLY-WYZ-15_(1-7)]HJL10082.1 LysM peptidoglycan-binding domain-containing M23 family metallopeptidase [Polyangiaceae bacterium LLY-WYZ-15_(1-7)]HJL33817.1 LysM peptidoglycan-binding domain-containing M23 family metallopeptidase [Polyangiaceae bacterium LLY-WYZ-15_(1-7)]HJL